MSRMYEELMEQMDNEFEEAMQVYEEEGSDAYYAHCENYGIEALPADALEVFQY